MNAASMVRGGDDPTGGLASVATASPDESAAALRAMPAHEAGQEAEGLFASMMLQEMRKSLPDGSFFGKGPGADVYDGMLEQFMGRELARQGGFGIAPMIEAQLKSDAAAREAASTATAASNTATAGANTAVTAASTATATAVTTKQQEIRL